MQQLRDWKETMFGQFWSVKSWHWMSFTILAYTARYNFYIVYFHPLPVLITGITKLYDGTALLGRMGEASISVYGCV